MRVCLLLLLGIVLGNPAFAQQDEQRLQALQAELKERQQALADSQATAEELQEVLKESELEIGRVARALEETRTALANNQAEQETLKTQQSSLKKAILNQQDMLASQLRSAFMAGHYDYAKMLFYQEDARKFERVVTYYQYLSKARQEAISEFRANVDKLKEVNARLSDKADELKALLARQQSQRASLVARQDDRKATLNKLNKKIASESERIAQLQENEQALVRAIEEAQRRAEQETQMMAGLAGSKGQLAAPADGRVRRLFGLRRQGQLRWKGIVIESNEGNAVKAVSGGRVLYADWLKGFGLVTIIDHGKGYMSVYGHNQALLKQSGDSVRPGDTIALVGQSGGQTYPNLYFEIRHKGKALNPSKWLAR
ncbi:murein hydrolase activator EnvC family protein [Alteromonas halophila]|uniref:Non-catalytic member of peptidase subfamily M23B n=1 Tax=Alteromonas halophila TaxID=516698 RepID=A0A918JG31_9ALTE|nr:peptidoglycan DD-metalloendopeptidase family protein [Alteromonas halophila]GGW79115.1 non-catalytic member of peptidase subfamily M23B [Alteromonas halophila]